MFRQVRHIHKESGQIISKGCTFVFPGAWTSCVSQEEAPKRNLNSAKVCASKASGTGVPSLNSNGTRISYLRNELIGGRANHRELDSLLCQETQGLSRHSRFTRSPALAREAWDKLAQRAFFGFFIREPDQNLHGSNLMPKWNRGKIKNAFGCAGTTTGSPTEAKDTLSYLCNR